MLSSKRKIEEVDDTDDDEPSLGRQILPVANLPEDYSGIPTNGMEYLFTVRRDARLLPHVTRAANPYEFEETQPSSSAQNARTLPSHTTVPTEEWRNLFVTRFRNFRKNLSQPTIYVDFGSTSSLQRVMPDKKERDLWWAFLSGKPESEWNPPKKLKQRKRRRTGDDSGEFTEHAIPFATDEHLSQESAPIRDHWAMDSHTELGIGDSRPLAASPALSIPSLDNQPSEAIHTSKPEMLKLAPREPFPSLLRRIDERMALHLLMYFTHWINLHLREPSPGSRPIESHARWIFALLSKVELHVSADDMNLLRNLARACLALLKLLIQERTSASVAMKPTADDGDMSERSCWMIITLIVGVWSQRDLWTEAEDMLRSLDS